MNNHQKCAKAISEYLLTGMNHSTEDGQKKICRILREHFPLPKGKPRYVYAVRETFDGKEVWATGEFDRCHPPGAYLGDWEEACIDTDPRLAKSHQEEFGGEVVKFRCIEEETL